jgi:hypothetical protein
MKRGMSGVVTRGLAAAARFGCECRAAAGTNLAPGSAIDIETLTMSRRSRQRAAVPLEPAIKVKLRRAGFHVVHERAKPHAPAPHVDDREIRGREIRFDDYRTGIACTRGRPPRRRPRAAQGRAPSAATRRRRQDGPADPVFPSVDIFRGKNAGFH